MGMVLQSYGLFPNMTAADNVGFGLRLRKRAAAKRRRRAAELLDMVPAGGHRADPASPGVRGAPLRRRRDPGAAVGRAGQGSRRQ
jgi:ABC-type Fe3+/spermidine/putrescine transport system ATPase subunit